MKLLDAPRAAEVAAVMAEKGILEIVFGRAAHAGRLTRLAQIESGSALRADHWTRLAALALDAPEDAGALAARLRLANSGADALEAAATPNPAYDPASPEKAARAWLYACGADAFRRGSLVAWASSPTAVDDALRKIRTTLPERWTAPALPVRGSEIMGLGVPAGPRVGEILKAFEAWWVGQDFPADPALHTETLKRLVNRG
jgi:poly(A) polymerase